MTFVARPHTPSNYYYCCKFLNCHIENYFFLAANCKVQLNNQFYKTTRELRTLFKNILERRCRRSANSQQKNIGDATATHELGKKNPSGASTCEPRAQAEFF